MDNWLAIFAIFLFCSVLCYLMVRLTIRRFLIRQKIFKMLIERKTREIKQKNEELEKK